MYSLMNGLGAGSYFEIETMVVFRTGLRAKWLLTFSFSDSS